MMHYSSLKEGYARKRIIIIKSLFKEDYILSIYILIYHMVLLKLNNKTYKHLDIIYMYDLYILYIYMYFKSRQHVSLKYT